MWWIVIGVAMIVSAIGVGFIKVDDVTWTHYRLIFPTCAGLSIGGGIVLIVASLTTGIE